MHEGIRGYFDKLAAEKNINCQYFLSRGGTDAAEAQYSGAIATTVGLPGRYIHTTAAIIDVRDVEAVKEMLLAIIYNFDKKALEEVNRNV
jgi:glutamyl aminopeptidase